MTGNKQKTILLLGGSAQQVVAIEAAKKLGYRTILCDYLPDNPGQYSSDKFYQISTTDVEAVYEVAKKENVGGVLAYASDPAALPAAMVCERLGLPTNPVKSVEILGVKHKFREFLRSNGFACPKSVTISPDESIDEIIGKIREFDFPIVVKPTDSSGSKGVSMLSDNKDILEAIKLADAYSRNKILIIEEYIERGFPNVIGGDIFVWNGSIVMYGEMSCLRGNGGKSLIPIGEKKPAGLNDRQMEAVHSELQRIVDKLGIRFGEMNIEILLDSKDQVHFLELGPRAGGNMIPIQLSDAYGIDLPKANVLAAMGEDPELRLQAHKGCYCTYVLHSNVSGLFGGLDIDEEIGQYIYRKCVYKKKGESVEIFDGAGKAVGIVFMKFPDEAEMNRLYPQSEKLIKVRVC